jgi:hypothetical protein
MAKNQNDWGVFKGSVEAGTDEWVKEVSPLVLSNFKDCINNLSIDAAITVSDYLTVREGVAFAPGRPHLHPPIG